MPRGAGASERTKRLAENDCGWHRAFGWCACRCAASLPRVAAFLAAHSGAVSRVLSGVEYTPHELQAAYAAIAYASLLLAPPDAATRLEFADNGAVARARAAVDRFNTKMGLCQRAAKEAILDARISAARLSSWNADVAACAVRAAVAKVWNSLLAFVR